jgi:hypothetical protein
VRRLVPPHGHRLDDLGSLGEHEEGAGILRKEPPEEALDPVVRLLARVAALQQLAHLPKQVDL